MPIIKLIKFKEKLEIRGNRKWYIIIIITGIRNNISQWKNYRKYCI